MNMEKSITDLSPSPTQLNDFCNHAEQKKKKRQELHCLVFTFGSDQPFRILWKIYQSDNMPIFQHAGIKQGEKKRLICSFLGEKKAS